MTLSLQYVNYMDCIMRYGIGVLGGWGGGGYTSGLWCKVCWVETWHCNGIFGRHRCTIVMLVLFSCGSPL